MTRNFVYVTAEVSWERRENWHTGCAITLEAVFSNVSRLSELVFR
jgi:hypothetical protein